MMTDANRSQDVNLGSIDLDYWRGAYRGPPARRSGGGRPSAPGYFDDLVGAHEHKVGHGQAERLNGSETLTNTIGIVARLLMKRGGDWCRPCEDHARGRP